MISGETVQSKLNASNKNRNDTVIDVYFNSFISTKYTYQKTIRTKLFAYKKK